jgi:hypothetical protein
MVEEAKKFTSEVEGGKGNCFTDDQGKKNEHYVDRASGGKNTFKIR